MKYLKNLKIIRINNFVHEENLQNLVILNIIRN